MEQENPPNDVASKSPIDVALQFSTQHRVYRAMLLMREPSGLLPAAMLPEQVSFTCLGRVSGLDQGGA